VVDYLSLRRSIKLERRVFFFIIFLYFFSAPKTGKLAAAQITFTHVSVARKFLVPSNLLFWPKLKLKAPRRRCRSRPRWPCHTVYATLHARCTLYRFTAPKQLFGTTLFNIMFARNGNEVSLACVLGGYRSAV
jgi:hypothetical protein